MRYRDPTLADRLATRARLEDRSQRSVVEAALQTYLDRPTTHRDAYTPEGDPREFGRGVTVQVLRGPRNHPGAHEIVVGRRRVRLYPDGRVSSNGRSRAISGVLRVASDLQSPAVIDPNTIETIEIAFAYVVGALTIIDVGDLEIVDQ